MARHIPKAARTSARKARRGRRRVAAPTDGAKLPTEHAEQAAFFQRVRNFLPHLRRLVFAIANGALRRDGNAAYMVAEGVERGTMDVMAAVPRAGFHGLFIEMKRAAGGVLSDDQDEALRVFSAMGYAVAVADGCDEAWATLMAYLELPT